MKHTLVAVIAVAFSLISPRLASGHAGHDHGTAPSAEAAVSGPVTLSDEALRNLGIQTMEATIAPMQRTVELIGRVQALPERQAKISSSADGRVTEILVKLGEHVKAGQPVLRFQPLSVGNPPVTLTSPIAGYVTRQDATLGQALTPETVLMEVADYREVLVRAAMFEGPEIGEIKPGQPARVQLDAFPNESFEGEVQRLDVGLETDSRTFEAYVLLNNPELRARPNMFATVAIGLGEPQEVLAVPRRAVLGDMGNLFVFVRDGNTFERRNVVLGMKAGDQLEILEGVLPGEQVVTQGNYQLQFASGVTKKGEKQDDATNTHPHSPTPSGQIFEAIAHRGGLLPGWAWGATGFVLGAFTFGFLLRRSA